MLTATVPDGTGILYIQCPPSFRMADLQRLVQDIDAGCWPGVTLSMPVILDARAAPMGGIPAAEIRRYLMRRIALSSVPGPLAAIARDVPSEAKLRLYCVLAHMMRLRDEGQSLVTDSLQDAVSWLADRLPGGGVDCRTLRRRIAQVQAPRPGTGRLADATL